MLLMSLIIITGSHSLVNSGDWYRLRVSAVSPKAQARALTFGAACTVYKVVRFICFWLG